MNVQREYAERLKYKPSLIEPFHKHELNPLFRELVLRIGYLKAIRRTLKTFVWKQKVKNTINYWKYLYKVPKKIITKLAN